MITRNNFEDVIASITPKDKKRINNSTKEYCIISLHVFNTGGYVTVKLTKNFKNVDYTSAIFETYFIQEKLTEI